MTTSKHLLAPGFRFLDPADLEQHNEGAAFRSTPDWQKIKAGEVCVLAHDDEGDLLLLPPVMKHFLQAFERPATIGDVTDFFAREARCQADEIAPTMHRFFDEMIDRGLLLRENAQKRFQKAVAENQKKAWKSGQRIGDFELLEKFSGKDDLAVWKARRVSTDENAVLKACFLNEKTPEKRRARRLAKFRQEFDLLAELQDHPSICSFFGLFEHENGLFAVLEFIEGRSPRRWLREEKPPLEAIIDVIRQLFESIGHLHGCGILQGDIHGSNFLIEKNGRVRLLDFDLANRARPAAGEIVHEGGVQEYIPPEKIASNVFDVVREKADFRSEVWQIGLVAFFVLYEKLPFEAFSWQGLADKILNAPPDFQPKTPLGEPISDRVLAVLKKTLEKNPADRFADGRACAAAFLAAV